MKTLAEIYALLEEAAPVADVETLDTSALVARIETELGSDAATATETRHARPATAPEPAPQPLIDAPSLRSWRGPVIAIAVAAIIVGAVLGMAALVGWVGTEPDVADTPTTVAPTPSATVVLTPAPDVEPTRVSTAIGDVDFVTLRFPPGHDFFEVVVTAYGPVAENESGLWWSTDYQTWHQMPAASDGTLISDGEDLIVVGRQEVVRLEWYGSGWIQQAPLDLPVAIDQIAFGPRGAVAVRASSVVYYSTDGVHFAEAERGPDTDLFVAPEFVPEEDRDFRDCRFNFSVTTGRINTVLATDAGFVALTAAAHPDGEVCEPLLWFSTDGNTWDLVSEDSPFGELSVVRAEPPLSTIAERNGRFVAIGEVGGQGLEDIHPAVWVSDDGLTWQPADIRLQDAGTVEAGEAGWMLIGAAGPENATYAAMWFSVDGFTWDGPHRLPDGLETYGYRMTAIDIGRDAIFGIGGDFDSPVPVVGRLRE